MDNFRRLILIVLDSVGVGALPDAEVYGDAGSHTLLHTAEAVGGLELPQLKKMGLGNIASAPGIDPVANPRASYGKMAEKSKGKDTTSGHWELAGLILTDPFPTFPQGFPPELVAELSWQAGREFIGNKAASGTEIIKELGAEHLQSRRPILYTSADSVLQIAAHEEIVSLDDLYRICGVARKIADKWHLSRVIARPFIGRPGSFSRTANRRDFALPPPSPTVLDRLKEAGFQVAGVGKIEDIFAGCGLTRSVHTKSNREGMEATARFIAEDFSGLIFANLVDFDMLFGHRNDPQGYARALREFDAFLPELIAKLRPDDLLIITADHGCDPTTKSTDHSREYVPLLVFHSRLAQGKPLGVRETFADVAQTIAENFGLEKWAVGGSFLHIL